MKTRIKKRYHWIIAAVMLLQLAVIGGLANNYNGLFILPITKELEISRASYSLAFTLKYLCSFFGTLLSGTLFLRYGNKKPMILGLLLCGAGYMILPLSTNIYLLAFGNILLGFGEALCCTAAVSRIISTWFHRYTGLVWGLVSASTGIGGSILCIILSGMIESTGWRSAYLLSASFAAATLLLALVFVRGRPEEIGLTPFGMGQIQKKKNKKAESERWEGYTMAQLKKQPAFYLALVTVFLSSFAIYLAYDIVVPHLQDQGLSQSEAVAQQSAMLVYLTLFKFLAGLLSDWLGSKTVTLGCTAFSVASLWVLAIAADPVSAGAAVLLYAIALPLPTVLIPLLTTKLFGYKAQNSYHGIFMALPQLGLLSAAPIANLVYDATGSYAPILLISAGLSGLALLLFAVLYISTGKLQKKQKPD